MNYVYRITSLFLPIVLVVLAGCNAKQDKPGATSGVPQEKIAAPAASKGAPGTTALPPQDMADARTAAAHVLAQLEAGDFPSIYKETGPVFKQIGSEDQFVGKFQQTRQRVGMLKNPREISADVRPDKNIVLVYRVENERFKTDMRLTFLRSKDGKMELAGLNQHDEPKK